MGHGWVSAGVSFWSAPPHDPEGAVSPADPARISPHSGHSAQPAVPPREAGALYPRKNHGKVPPPPQQDPRDPPHSHGNAPMGHGCVSGGVRRVRDGLARAPGALRGRYYDRGFKGSSVSAAGAAGCPGCRECRECRECRWKLRREGLQDQFRPGHAEESTGTHSHGNSPMGHRCGSAGVTAIAIVELTPGWGRPPGLGLRRGSLTGGDASVVPELGSWRLLRDNAGPAAGNGRPCMWYMPGSRGAVRAARPGPCLAVGSGAVYDQGAFSDDGAFSGKIPDTPGTGSSASASATIAAAGKRAGNGGT